VVLVMRDLSKLRTDYESEGLSETRIEADPLTQFRRWLDEAIEAGVPEPNAMAVSSVDSSGRPSARIVLLRGLDEQGFVFYTNYESRKGQQLAANPFAALTFFWAPLHRQVRIEGRTVRVTDSESDSYFAGRPRASQIGAWASRQSSAIHDRNAIEQEVARLEQVFAGQEVPRPPFWGGFRVRPSLIEFWQGRPSRLHDRLQYSVQADGSWILERLSP
jgi:pyridoxamine 5'-phosphate oxidase